MKIRVNGEERSVPAGATLAEVLRELEIAGPVAVARNGTGVPRGQHDATRLAPGDEIEIVRPVQGG